MRRGRVDVRIPNFMDTFNVPRLLSVSRKVRASGKTRSGDVICCDPRPVVGAMLLGSGWCGDPRVVANAALCSGLTSVALNL